MDKGTITQNREGFGSPGFTFPFGGSDASAASGRYSELSEWLWSVSDAGVCAKESTGYHNRKVDRFSGG